eukprot:2630074-Amphidinium_carterae.1
MVSEPLDNFCNFPDNVTCPICQTSELSELESQTQTRATLCLAAQNLKRASRGRPRKNNCNVGSLTCNVHLCDGKHSCLLEEGGW